MKEMHFPGAGDDLAGSPFAITARAAELAEVLLAGWCDAMVRASAADLAGALGADYPRALVEAGCIDEAVRIDVALAQVPFASTLGLQPSTEPSTELATVASGMAALPMADDPRLVVVRQRLRSGDIERARNDLAAFARAAHERLVASDRDLRLYLESIADGDRYIGEPAGADAISQVSLALVRVAHRDEVIALVPALLALAPDPRACAGKMLEAWVRADLVLAAMSPKP